MHERLKVGTRFGFALSLGLLGALALGGAARAGTGDGFGFGVGTGLGVHSSSSPDNAGDSGVIGDINLRARFLWMLGLDLRFNLQDEAAVTVDDGPQYAARYRTTALVYVVPTDVVSVYLGGGIGAVKGSELLSTGAAGSSYHAGIGAEWYVSDLVALDASFMMIIPGWRSVERDVERRADLEIARYKANPSGGTPTVPSDLPIGDYVSLNNFELMVRGMIVF
ncbi:MAG: outer membrane beta-barrel protein [Myxococcales bacterium]|nr:outer membrane beta-barrel protein [Myxococcales bacterium]MCB9733937.1 outer membrane beta-barrel protein [Deltaproteobacteria bacterium]